MNVMSPDLRPRGKPDGIERRRRRRDLGFKLKLSITSAFAALLLVTIVTLVSFAYYKNTGSTLDLTQRFVARVAAAGGDRTVALLDPVAAEVVAMAEIAAVDETRARDGSLFPYLRALLDRTPQLQSVYYAFGVDGRFIQAFPIPPGTEKFGANDRPPPPGAVYALRLIDRAGGRYSDVWRYLAADGGQVGEETSNQLDYDPRPRPWYRDAVSSRDLVWSDLLVYTSNRQPGITAAYPIVARDGRIIGVAAANIATRQLSDFLASLDLGPSGIAFIIDEKEQLIAFPDADRAVHIDGLKASLVKADELGLAEVSDALAAHRADPARVVRFASDGRRHLASFTGLPERFGKKWLLAIVVLEDDFVGSLKRNTRDIVGVGLAILVLGMFGVGLLSSWITRPIVRMVGEIHKIQRFDLGDPIALHAPISEITALINALNMMKRALRTFGMFVPRDLVRQLLESGQPVELGGQDRPMTVMFTDVADFTALSERIAPGELMVHLSQHLAAVSECVMDEFGTVDKYIGDAVMAFWGAPEWRDDHALRACVAALRAKRRQAEMNRGWAAQGLPTLHVRIGLNSAGVIVGNIGSEQRMSYTVVGDGVNLASRIEGVNKVYGTQICISDSVATAVGGAILTRPLDVVAVKGRIQGEKLHELVALREGPAELLATPAETEICRLTAQAFAAYQERRWEDAAALYRQIAALAPDDRVPGLFIERCRACQADPPPPDWSGVWRLTEK